MNYRLAWHTDKSSRQASNRRAFEIGAAHEYNQARGRLLAHAPNDSGMVAARSAHPCPQMGQEVQKPRNVFGGWEQVA